MIRLTNLFGLAVASLCLLSVGCKSPMAGGDLVSSSDDETPGAVQLASATRASAVTFLDLESLRYGTGPMDSSTPGGFQMTPSGLRYRILRKSGGPRPTAANTVKVNYRGWLDSGKEFDSSYERSPIEFPLNGVIPGWTEGMQLVGEGGMIELWVPASMGYGKQGKGASVPPNATLHFVVELISVI